MSEPVKRLTRAKAIRAKCLDCCCGQAKEVRLCTVQKCPLFPYRMGKEDKGIYFHGEDEFDEKTPQNSYKNDLGIDDIDDIDCEVMDNDWRE